MKNKQLFLYILSFSIICLVILVLGFIEPIAQNKNYHNFADTRELLNIPNFFNVVSNIGFLLVGCLALYKIFIAKSLNLSHEIKRSYILFFVAIAFVSFGSGYYHLSPNNETLLWDRLPMGVAFMALISIIVSEFIFLELGKKILFPLVFLALSSILYWYWGELLHMGDLRFYALIQFVPMIVIPIVLLLFTSNFNNTKAYWWVLFCYFLAKLFEHFDKEVYSFIHVISGHSIKHLIAAFGLYLLVISYETRIKEKHT